MHEPKAMREIRGFTAGAAKGAAFTAGEASGRASCATKGATVAANVQSRHHVSLRFIRVSSGKWALMATKSHRLPQVGARLRRVRSPTNIPVPAPPLPPVSKVGTAPRAVLVASLPRVGSALRADLVASRIARSAIPTCSNLCTFPQAVGRFALLHLFKAATRSPFSLPFHPTPLHCLSVSLRLAHPHEDPCTPPAAGLL